jgi:chromosome segregation ATPase
MFTSLRIVLLFQLFLFLAAQASWNVGSSSSAHRECEYECRYNSLCVCTLDDDENLTHDVHVASANNDMNTDRIGFTVDDGQDHRIIDTTMLLSDSQADYSIVVLVDLVANIEDKATINGVGEQSAAPAATKLTPVVATESVNYQDINSFSGPETTDRISFVSQPSVLFENKFRVRPKLSEDFSSQLRSSISFVCYLLRGLLGIAVDIASQLYENASDSQNDIYVRTFASMCLVFLTVAVVEVCLHIGRFINFRYLARSPVPAFVANDGNEADVDQDRRAVPPSRISTLNLPRSPYRRSPLLSSTISPIFKSDNDMLGIAFGGSSFVDEMTGYRIDIDEEEHDSFDRAVNCSRDEVGYTLTAQRSPEATLNHSTERDGASLRTSPLRQTSSSHCQDEGFVCVKCVEYRQLCLDLEQQLSALQLDKLNGDRLLSEAMEKMLPLLDRDMKMGESNAKLSQENVERSEQVGVLQAEIASVTKQNAVLSVRVDGLKGVNDALQQQYDELQAEIHETSQKYGLLQTNYAGREATILELGQNVEVLKRDLIVADEQYRRLQSQHSDIVVNFSTKEKELQQRYYTSDSVFDQSLNNLKAENALQVASIREMEQAVSEYKNAQAEVVGLLTDETEKYVTLLACRDEEISQLTSRSAYLEEMVQCLKRDLADLEGERRHHSITPHQESAIKLESHVMEISKQQDLSSCLLQAISVINIQNRCLEATSQQLVESESEIRDLRTSTGFQSSQQEETLPVEQTSSILQDRLVRLAEEKAIVEHELTTYEACNERLKLELQERVVRATDMETGVVHANSVIAAVSEELASSTAENLRLREELLTAQTALDHRSNNVNTLRSEVELSESKLQELQRQLDASVNETAVASELYQRQRAILEEDVRLLKAKVADQLESRGQVEHAYNSQLDEIRLQLLSCEAKVHQTSTCFRDSLAALKSQNDCLMLTLESSLVKDQDINNLARIHHLQQESWTQLGADLDTHVEALSKQLCVTREELASNNMLHESYDSRRQQEIDDCKQKLQEFAENVQHLESEVGDLKEENFVLQNENIAADSCVTAIRTELAEQRVLCSALQEIAAASEDFPQQLAGMVIDNKRLLDSGLVMKQRFETSLIASLKAVHEVSTALQTATTSLRERELELSNLRSELVAVGAQKTDLETVNLQARQVLESKDTEIKSLLQLKENLLASVQHHEDKQSAFMEQQTALKEEMELLKTYTSDAESKLAFSNEEIGSLKSQIVTLHDELNHSSECIHGLKKEQLGLLQILQEKDAQILSNSEQTTHMEVTLGALQVDQLSSQDRILALENEIQQLHCRLLEHVTAVQVLRAQLEVSEQALQSQVLQLATMKEDKDSATTKYSIEHETNAHLSLEIYQLKERLSDLSETSARLQTEASEFSSRCSEQDKELSCFEIYVEALRAERDENEAWLLGEIYRLEGTVGVTALEISQFKVQLLDQEQVSSSKECERNEVQAQYEYLANKYNGVAAELAAVRDQFQASVVEIGQLRECLQKSLLVLSLQNECTETISSQWLRGMQNTHELHVNEIAQQNLIAQLEAESQVMSAFAQTVREEHSESILSAQMTVSQHEATMSSLQHELLSCNERICENERALDAKQSEIRFLISENSNLQKAASTSSSTLRAVEMASNKLASRDEMATECLQSSLSATVFQSQCLEEAIMQLLNSEDRILVLEAGQLAQAELIEELTHEKHVLEQELSVCKDCINTLRGELSFLDENAARQTSSHQEIVGSLSARLEILNEEVAAEQHQLREQKAHYETCLSSADNAAAEASHRLSTVSKLLESKEAEFASLSTDMQILHAKITGADEVNLQQGHEISVLVLEVERFKKLHETALALLKDKDLELRDGLTAFMDLEKVASAYQESQNAVVHELTTQVADSLSCNRSKDAALESLRRVIDIATSDSEMLMTKARELESENNALRIKLERVQTENESVCDSLEAYEICVRGFQRELAAQNLQLAESAKLASDLEEQKSAYQQEASRNDTEKSILSNRIEEDLQERNRILQFEIVQLQSTIESQTNALEKFRREANLIDTEEVELTKELGEIDVQLIKSASKHNIFAVPTGGSPTKLKQRAARLEAELQQNLLVQRDLANRVAQLDDENKRLKHFYRIYYPSSIAQSTSLGGPHFMNSAAPLEITDGVGDANNSVMSIEPQGAAGVNTSGSSLSPVDHSFSRSLSKSMVDISQDYVSSDSEIFPVTINRTLSSRKSNMTTEGPIVRAFFAGANGRSFTSNVSGMSENSESLNFGTSPKFDSFLSDDVIPFRETIADSFQGSESDSAIERLISSTRASATSPPATNVDELEVRVVSPRREASAKATNTESLILTARSLYAAASTPPRKSPSHFRAPNSGSRHSFPPMMAADDQPLSPTLGGNEEDSVRNRYWNLVSEGHKESIDEQNRSFGRTQDENSDGNRLGSGKRAAVTVVTSPSRSVSVVEAPATVYKVTLDEVLHMQSAVADRSLRKAASAMVMSTDNSLFGSYTELARNKRLNPRSGINSKQTPSKDIPKNFGSKSIKAQELSTPGWGSPIPAADATPPQLLVHKPSRNSAEKHLFRAQSTPDMESKSSSFGSIGSTASPRSSMLAHSFSASAVPRQTPISSSTKSPRPPLGARNSMFVSPNTNIPSRSIGGYDLVQSSQEKSMSGQLHSHRSAPNTPSRNHRAPYMQRAASAGSTPSEKGAADQIEAQQQAMLIGLNKYFK